MHSLTTEERRQAFASVKKPETVGKQRLPVRYHVEDFDVDDRPRRFLEAFAAILKHTNYRVALDHYIRVSAKCSRCTVKCQVYLATGDATRHSLLPLRAAAVGLPPPLHDLGRAARRAFWAIPALTDETIQEMADALLQLHRLPPLPLRMPDGDRSRPASPIWAATSSRRSASSRARWW